MLLNAMKKDIVGKKIKIVFTEGEDTRILGAAHDLAREDLVMPVIVGDMKVIEKTAQENDIDLKGCMLIDIEDYGRFDEMVDTMFELRKGKQTREECQELLRMSNYFGTMLVKMGIADGLVGGATYSTADTVRPALQLIKTKPGTKTVSSCFIMHKGDQKFVMGDCAIVIDPSAEDLANIAIASAHTARIFGIDPKVAFLSYSTKGSGFGPAVKKVQNAVELMKDFDVDFAYDGEFQFDAAIVPTVAKLKAPGSPVAGNANVFVFPSLESGNIGYKIAQRLGGYGALGPILQGLNAPINDLSRGCSREDVYELSIVTAAQSLIK